MAENKLLATIRDGQSRRAWLDDTLSAADNKLRYFLGPTGIPDKLSAVGNLLNYTDAGDVTAAADASRSMWNNPSIGNAAELAAAAGALAIPFVGARMMQDGVDIVGSVTEDLMTGYNPNRLNIFAGPSAKTADVGALAKAQEMAEAGASRDDIWKDTGWFTGADGKWRFEIDDSASRATVKTNNYGLVDPDGGSGALFGDVVPHDQASAAYPDVANIDTLYGRGYGGEYTPHQSREHLGLFDIQEEVRLRGKDPEGIRSVALHEGQHAIQRRENFARGGNPGEFKDGIYSHLENTRRERGDIFNAAFRSEELGIDPLDSITQAARASGADPEKWRRVYIEYGGEQGLWDSIRDLDTQMAQYNPQMQYQRLAGEVEARNVQARRDFTPEQRRATPPWQTQDVPDDAQILRFGTGDQMSIRAYLDAPRTLNKLSGLEPAGSQYGMPPSTGATQ